MSVQITILFLEEELIFLSRGVSDFPGCGYFKVSGVSFRRDYHNVENVDVGQLK